MDYNLVQIGATFLTSTGYETGTPCKVTIDGLDALALQFTGSTVSTADGTSYSFVLPTDGRGRVLTLAPLAVTVTVLDALKLLIADALTNSTLINVIITGEIDNYDLQCLPTMPKPINYSGNYVGDRLFDVVLNFTISTVTL